MSDTSLFFGWRKPDGNIMQGLVFDDMYGTRDEQAIREGMASYCVPTSETKALCVIVPIRQDSDGIWVEKLD